MSKFISKKDLNSWLNKVRENRRLVAPTKVEDLILFKEISKVEDIAPDYVNTDMSPKEFLFPPTEVLFSIAKKDGSVELTPGRVEKETVIFGMRPCDAKGVIALDKPFLEEPGDPLYKEHRDKTFLVGIACLKACAECFCSSMGGGPDDPAGLDVMLEQKHSAQAFRQATPTRNVLSRCSL